jgi:hypothetical protein
MNYKTSFRNLNGSWYCLVPSEFARYMELEGEESLEGVIQSEEGKHGKYCSIWKKGS